MMVKNTGLKAEIPEEGASPLLENYSMKSCEDNRMNAFLWNQELKHSDLMRLGAYDGSQDWKE